MEQRNQWPRRRRIAATSRARQRGTALPVLMGCTPLLVATLGASAASAANAAANAASGTADTQQIETMIVVGTRTERSLSDTAATVDVISAEQLQRELARDIADMVRFEPGVSVAGSGSRFGLEGFNIRGIDGNRVLTLVDGIRVPEQFSFGPFLSARRDFVDVDSLARAEIARGPISSLYGSDALGGVVALTTLGPRDLITASDPLAGTLRTGYSSADDSAVVTANVAAGNERVAGLLTFTRRAGAETNTAGGFGGTGPAREQPDPAELDTRNLDLKGSYSFAEGHELGLSAFRYASDADSNLLSDAGTVARGVLTRFRETADSRTRRGFAIDYRYRGNALGLSDLQLKLYRQRSRTTQLTFDERLTLSTAQRGAAPAESFRQRDSQFEQDIDGLYGQLTRAFQTRAMDHQITAGIDLYRTDNASIRRGATLAADGAPVLEFMPLPTRDFPLTEVQQAAVFVQDEITLLEGRLLLSPGLRFDRYQANAAADAIYLSGNPGIETPVDYEDSELTFKLGAVYKIGDALSVYGRYSEGFRAPPYDDVNVGFTNFVGGYKTIANAQMNSETSRGVELGTRLRFDGFALSAAIYRNNYQDFIESQAIAPQFAGTGGIDPADGLLTFQSVNRSAVTISGAELTLNLALARLSPALEGLRARAAVAYAQGKDTERNQPLNSVEPLNGVVGLGFDAPSGRWGAEAVVTLAAGKARADIDQTQARVATGGYAIADLFGYVRLHERVSLDVGLFNLTDRRYLRWIDTAGIGADAAGRFAQPARNFAATLRVDL